MHSSSTTRPSTSTPEVPGPVSLGVLAAGITGWLAFGRPTVSELVVSAILAGGGAVVGYAYARGDLEFHRRPLSRPQLAVTLCLTGTVHAMVEGAWVRAAAFVLCFAAGAAAAAITAANWGRVRQTWNR